MTVGDSIELGAYIVRCMMRPDNPYFPRYVIFRRNCIVGIQFSMPCLSDCTWHDRRKGKYAEPEESQQDFRKYGYFVRPGGRPSRAEQERRAVLAQFEVDAEVSA